MCSKRPALELRNGGTGFTDLQGLQPHSFRKVLPTQKQMWAHDLGLTAVSDGLLLELRYTEFENTMAKASMAKAYQSSRIGVRSSPELGAHIRTCTVPP